MLYARDWFIGFVALGIVGALVGSFIAGELWTPLDNWGSRLGWVWFSVLGFIPRFARAA